MPKILSIIIPTRNREGSLQNCLASLERNTTDYETIVIDGLDGYNIKLNRGIKMAKGKFLVFLHDDNTVTPGWANELADVGSFKLGESMDAFDHWGGYYWPTQAYCINEHEHPQYPGPLCLSKLAAKHIGEFDEFYHEPGYQDVDLGFQIEAAGYKIECLPGKIIHWAERTKPLDERNRTYLHKKWNLK